MYDQSSDIIRTLECVPEVQIINNKPKKSVFAIPREKGMDEKFTKPVVHEDISYVSYKMRRGQFLSKGMQEK